MTNPDPPPIEDVEDLLGQFDAAIEQVHATASAAERRDDAASTDDRDG